MFKHAKMLLALFILASIALFIGCQEESTVITPDSGRTNLSKISDDTLFIPSGATVTSAKLFIYQTYTPVDQTNNVHRITSDWPCDVTWATFAGAYDGFVFDSFLGAELTWQEVDITTLVQAWVNGTYANYGILLDDPAFIGRSQFHSTENATNQPYFEVVLSTGDTIDVTPSADTWIWEAQPNSSACDDPFLYTGYINDPLLGLHKQSLLRFPIVVVPGGGCTLTPGYWKTHSEFGPAPYDDTWAQLPNGASTIFFLSGKTYYEVLWTSPAGNAYYNLSFHYIAAGLNFMNGADPSAAQAAYDAATILFNTYTPAQIAVLRGSDPLRQQFISLAGILGQYNEGYIGPGHCD